MISLKIIQLLITSLTLLLAYILVISPVGWFRAWVAQKMGDHTAEDLGFLTLNPAVHVDTVGTIVLLFFGVGWGKHIPINPSHIHGKHRGLKIATAYFSDTIAHILLGTLALFLFIMLFGVQSLGLYAAQVSSLSISVARIIIAFIHLNVFLAAIAVVINAMMWLTWYIAEKNIEMPPYFFYVIIFAPMLILIIFGEELRFCMFGCITALGKLFACLLGIK